MTDDQAAVARAIKEARKDMTHPDGVFSYLCLTEIADLRTLIAAAEAGERDARRYGWLRPRLYSSDWAYGDPPRSVITFLWPNLPIGIDLDAAIDAAIAKETK